MTQRLGLMLTIGLVLMTELVDGTNNCNWDSVMKGLEAGDESIIIEVSRDDHGYGNNVSCETKVYASDQSRHLRVEVDFFQLIGSSALGSACLVESERLTFQMETATGVKSVTWCGQLYAEKHIFPTWKLTLRYTTGKIGQGSGQAFNLRVSSVVPNSKDNTSSEVFRADEKPRLLYSPGYPYNYLRYGTHTVTLRGNPGSYIVIRVLKTKNQEGYACMDFMKINGERYCGFSNGFKEIMIYRSKAEISYRGSPGGDNAKYILEYAGYAVEYSAGRLTHVAQVPKVLHVPAFRIYMKLRAIDPNQTLHIFFFGEQNGFFECGTLSEKGGGSLPRLPKQLKHYWSKSRQVTFKVCLQPVPKDFYILVESVSGFPGGLLLAEKTAAWLESDSGDRTDFKVYLPEWSSGNIGVEFAGRMRREETAVHNGPSTSYFDLVKGCYPTFPDPETFVSRNTKMVTVGMKPEQWRRGVWALFYSTDKTPEPQAFFGEGSLNLLDFNWNKTTRNYFCSLVFRGTSLTTTSLAVKTNLDIPDSVVIKKEEYREHFTEVSSSTGQDNYHVDLLFSTTVMEINVVIDDPANISVHDPKVLIDVKRSRKGSLAYNNPQLVASSYNLKEVSAPPFLILEPTDNCSWSISRESDPRKWRGQTFLALTVFGVTTERQHNSNGKPCATLDLVSTLGEDSKSLTVCGGVENREAYTYSYPVTVTLRRQKRWVELPEPLFSYGLVKNNVLPVPPSNMEMCPPLVTLGEGEHFQFSSSTMTLPDTLTVCEIRLSPRSQDSSIIVTGSFMLGTINSLTMTGFDPDDPLESPLVEKDLVGTVEGQNWYTSKNYEFHHMALKIKAVLSPLAFFHFIFMLKKDSPCGGPTTLVATDNSKYIVSPNYPQPFSGTINCIWTISASKPLHLELVDFGGGNCDSDYLYIDYGNHDRARTKICQSTGRREFYQDEETINSYKCCRATVQFHASEVRGQPRWTKFKLHYKTLEHPRKGFEGSSSRGSKSDTTGVAIGSTIATMLLVLMIGTAVIVFVTHRRRVRHEQQQRNRRNLLRNRNRNRSGQHRSAGGDGDDGDDGSNSTTTSVFIVGSMVVSTRSPPPPYPGLPEEGAGGAGYANNNNNNNNSNNNNNNAGRSSSARGSHSHIAAATGSENRDVEEPPPYHPLMPGSPFNTEEQFYFSFSPGTRDSGISDTLYSVAQTGRVEEGHGAETGASYSLASPTGREGQTQLGNDRRTAVANHSTEAQDESTNGSRDAGHATPEDRQAPPPYELANPLHPPPAYDVAVSPENTESQRRNGNPGPL